MVMSGLAVRERLAALQANARTQTPEQFRIAWEQFLVDMQVHL